MTEQLQITDLQLSILQILWERGHATVGEVHEALTSERQLAPSTVATLLARLEKRDVVARHGDGRRYLYHPLVTLDDIRASMVSELTSLLFSDDAVGLVAHLVSSGAITREDRYYLRGLFPLEEEPPPTGA